jgi:hypothetical protein
MHPERATAPPLLNASRPLLDGRQASDFGLRASDIWKFPP